MIRLSVDELKKLRDKLQVQQTVRMGKARATVNVHMGTCGISAGAREILTALLKALEQRGITDVQVSTSGCAGLCSREPMATVQFAEQPPVKYVDLNAERIIRVLEEHVVGGNIVREFALAVGSERVG
jgi:NADP-reducing hydrogenase subunit HndB